MEMKKLLESLQECGMDMPPAPMQQGTPVSMNVSINASGKDHVADLIDMMKNAGMGGAAPVSQDMMPIRTDIERLRSIVDGPKDDEPMMKLPAPEEMEMEDEVEEEGYENEPEEAYGDLSDAIPDGDDLHRKKKAYAKAQDGDNAMAVESIKDQLYAMLSEKKATEGRGRGKKKTEEELTAEGRGRGRGKKK
jgi:hypothetical protein